MQGTQAIWDSLVIVFSAEGRNQLTVTVNETYCLYNFLRINQKFILSLRVMRVSDLPAVEGTPL